MTDSAESGSESSDANGSDGLGARTVDENWRLIAVSLNGAGLDETSGLGVEQVVVDGQVDVLAPAGGARDRWALLKQGPQKEMP